MSALVHPENQKVIWNIVNNNIYVNDYFQTHSHVSKEQWFRSIIEKFYMQNEGKNLSIEELNNLNKDVLTFMVKSVHSIPVQREETVTPPPSNAFVSQPPTNYHSQMQQPPTNYPSQIQQPPTNYPSQIQQPQNNYPSQIQHSQNNYPSQIQHSQNNYPSQIQTPPSVPNNIGEQTNREFEEKKQEYERMYAKPVPEEVDFKEQEKDAIIDNMDELINKHIHEREIQMKELAPPLLMNVEPVVAMPNNALTNVEPVVAMPNNNTTNNIHTDVQEISNTPTNNNEIQTVEAVNHDHLRIEISELKDELKRVQKEHEQMKRELNDKIEGQSLTMSTIQGEIVVMRENVNKINYLDQRSDKSDE